MMPLEGLQNYVPPPMTFIFDLLTSRLDLFVPLPHGQLANLQQIRFIRFQNIVFASLVADERTDGRTNERTGRKHNSSTCRSGLADILKARRRGYTSKSAEAKESRKKRGRNEK